MLNLLMSAQAQATFGDRIAEVLCELPYRILNLDAAPNEDGQYPIQVAFLSRDITANSGKIELAPSLSRFYEILRASPALRWLQGHAAGADRPIYSELRRRGVCVTTGSGTNAEPVAQMAIAGILALARRLPGLMEAQQQHQWAPLLGEKAPEDLKEQTAVVIGLGPIGLEIARLLKALRMRVIGVRRSNQLAEHVDAVSPIEQLSSVLPDADWLVLACPLNPQTRGLVNEETIAQLPRGARIINISRGEVVVEADLIEGVRSGQLGGAFLDVFVNEPLEPDHAFWSLPNVMVTPHTAAHTTGHYEAVGELFLENLERWNAGASLVNQMRSATAN